MDRGQKTRGVQDREFRKIALPAVGIVTYLRLYWVDSVGGLDASNIGAIHYQS